MGYDYYDYGYDSYSSGLGGIFAGAMIVPLLIGAFSIFVMWKIFVKAGKAGWIALVPFYNVYTLFEITWGNGWLFLLILVSIIPVIGWIAAAVISIMTMIKLGKAFGKSDGFIVGLVLLSIVFLAIIAFDDSTYLGVPKKDNANQQPMNNQNNYNAQPTQNDNMMNNQNTDVTPEPVSSPSMTFCSGCGTQMSEDTAFCPNCGKPKSN